MRNPRRLPDAVSGEAFNRRTAADNHLPLGRLRRRDIVRPYRGVYAEEPPETVIDRCRAYAVRMRPGDVFSHVTAAVLHGLPLPASLEQREAVDVATVHPAAAPSTAGVLGHRLRSAPDSALLDGLRVCAPVESWCQLAGLLDLEDLVAVADHLLGDGRTPGVATREQLEAAVALPGRYRRTALRDALRLARVGSRSAAESRMRVVLVLAGIPEPALNAEVRGRDGRVLGHGDTVWEARRVVGEYESERHRTDREQWAYDIRRYEEFHAELWTVVRVTAIEMRRAERPALIARFRRALGL